MACVAKTIPVVNPPSRLVKGFNPSAVPVIASLNPNNCKNNTYAEINIIGENFFPQGISYVKFGSFNLPATYNSSFGLTFYLPLQVPNGRQRAGQYTVQVVNRYSKLQVTPVNLYSNKVTFTVSEALI